MRMVCTTSINLATKVNRLECTCMNSDDFTVLVSGGVDTVSEHVYCVAVAFKMTEWIEQRICIKFCIKLKHSSIENIQLIQKAAAMGNWWLQLHHDNMPTHASRLMQSFLAKHQITQVTQPPYNPGLAPCDFWIFPELKSSLKGKRFQMIGEIQENTRQLMVTGRTVWGPKVHNLKGTSVSLSYV